MTLLSGLLRSLLDWCPESNAGSEVFAHGAKLRLAQCQCNGKQGAWTHMEESHIAMSTQLFSHLCTMIYFNSCSTAACFQLLFSNMQTLLAKGLFVCKKALFFCSLLTSAFPGYSWEMLCFPFEVTSPWEMYSHLVLHFVIFHPVYHNIQLFTSCRSELDFS